MTVRKYNVIAVISILLLAAILLTACAADPLGSEKAALQSDWEAYLEFWDEIYGQTLWAYEYAGAFTRDNTWESLLKARAACTAVKLSLQELTQPQSELTQQQYLALMEAGVEADVVLAEYENMDVLISDSLLAIDTLDALLTDDVYLTASMTALAQWVENRQAIVADSAEYLCITTNYLLLELDADSLWKKMTGSYPTLWEFCGAWNDDQQALMELSDAVLDRYPERITVQNELIGISGYTLELIQEAVNTGNYDRLIRQIHTIDGVPAYIPVPSWIPVEASWHYQIEDPKTGELRQPGVGEALTDIAACRISCPGISREDVASYAEALKQWGLEPTETTDEDTGEYKLVVSAGDAVLNILWTREETVLSLSDPICCLIPSLYLAAMNMN